MPSVGDINVTIYTGERQLWAGGRVQFKLVDPFSNTEKILVDHSTNPKTATVLLKGAPADKGQRYALLASTKGHRDAGIYPLQPIPDGVRHTAVMFVTNKPEPDFSKLSFDRLAETSPAFRQAIDRSGISEQAFLGLDSERLAGALNIEAKLRNTKLADVAAVDFLHDIGSAESKGTDGFRRDRIFARVSREMPEAVINEIARSESFSRLPEWANEVLHEGYPISFKQRLPFGSLQLSFSDQPDADGLLAADIDIDLFTDIGHWGEVLRNKFTKKQTDPFTVFVQLFDQRIFPLYLIKKTTS